jgi:flagellar biosynthesis/type III secretory pathway protein FliH
MPSLTRGRLVEKSRAAAAKPVALPGMRAPRGRVVPASLLDAADRARQIVARAEEQAAALIEAARRGSAEARLRAVVEGRAEGTAAVAAHALRLAEREASLDALHLDRSVALARVLAERLLGEALVTDPSKVAALARAALSEARGARRVSIAAHPDDVAELGARLGELGFDPSAITLRADPARQRGQLRLETDIGVLDADLAPQLDRLLTKLRESLGR